MIFNFVIQTVDNILYGNVAADDEIQAMEQLKQHCKEQQYFVTHMKLVKRISEKFQINYCFRVKG